MKIFIGSSSEEELKVYKIKEKINNIGCGYEVLPWFNSLKVSDYTMNSLINISNEVDCAIFIFAGDDKVNNNRGEFVKTRDNVILEYGLFVGVLGIENVAIVYKDKPEIASDLKGITYVPMNEDFESTLRVWLNNVSNNVKSEIVISKDNSVKVLERGIDGYYSASIIDRRHRISKNGNNFTLYKLDGIIDTFKDNLVSGESHWLCYEDGKFSDLSNTNRARFKIKKIKELYEAENTRNIYVDNVIEI